MTRKLGMFSAPAGVLVLCLLLAAGFVWGASQGMAHHGAEDAGPLSFSLTEKAALFGFPVLVPLLLIAVHRLHWRLMRPWLRQAVRGMLALWALAAVLMGYALL